MSAALPTLAFFIAANVAPPEATSPADATAAAPRWRRREQVAGAVALPLGLVALGALLPMALGYRRTALRADELHTSLGCTEADRAVLGRLASRARREEAAIVTLGVAAGVLLTTGVILLVRGRRPPPRVRLGLDIRANFGGIALSGRF